MERKDLSIERSADGWILASAPNVDRDKDRVMTLGLDLTNYRKNPVIFFGHSYTDPWSLIGKAAQIEQDISGLRILPELREPVNDNDPMTIVKALWESGLLRAASIGFAPTEARPNEMGGRDIMRAELLEISLVSLPANQDALRLAAKAMDITEEELDAKGPEETAEATKETAGNVDEAGRDADGTSKETGTEEATEETVIPIEEATAEQELRLAGILAEFVNSIRPYLSIIQES